LALALAFASGEAPLAADLVLLNGKIWTVDPKQPEAPALAVWHGRILKVGPDADVKPLIGPATKVIDLKGRRVAPGFYDSHVHWLGGGASLAEVDLKLVKDEAEFGQ